MAKVTFKEGQPIQSLSGKLGNYVFRTINGVTRVHVQQLPELAKDATRAEKRKYRRKVMIEACVGLLQNEMEDVVAAIEMRTKIKDRISRLYDTYASEIKAPTKLQKRIISAYRAKHSNKHVMHSTKPGNNHESGKGK